MNLYNVNKSKNQDDPLLSNKKNTAANTPARFETYVAAPEEIAGEDLAWGERLLRVRPELYHWGIRVLGVAGVLLCVYGFGVWGYYAVSGFAFDEQLGVTLTRFSNYTLLFPHTSAEPLQIGSVQQVPGGVNKTDLVVDVSNPNSRFVAEFDYGATGISTTTTMRSTFLLPGETRPLVVFGLSSEEISRGASVVVGNITWHYLPIRTVPGIDTWAAERLQFNVNNMVFTSGASDTGAVARLQFDVVNNSAYGYRHPKLLVAFLDGGTLQGVREVEVDDFAAGEKKSFDLRSFIPLRVTGVVVYPLINIYNKQVYLPIRSE